MTLTQVAEKYDAPVARVRAWIKNGELVAVDVSRKAGSRKPRYVVTEAALADFERSRSTRPAVKVKRRKGRVVEYV